MPKLSSSTDVVFLAGKRTPIGAFLGDFVNTSATTLATCAAQGALAASTVDAKDV